MTPGPHVPSHVAVSWTSQVPHVENVPANVINSAGTVSAAPSFHWTASSRRVIVLTSFIIHMPSVLGRAMFQCFFHEGRIVLSLCL